jgi:iron complex transport system substrate-binding protein
VTQRVLLVLAAVGLFACTETPPPDPPPAVYARIVSLAPNLTELVYAAGAGDTLVGVSAYSDYPAAALELPIIGDAFTVDQEQLALLQPDALLVWESGIPEHVVEDFRRVGYQVEIIRSRGLLDVALALRRIGELTGHEVQANAAADAFLADLDGLRERYQNEAAVSVFYQVYQRPLYTINGEHYVSELIEVCGGRNIFADLDSLAPAVSVEAVIERNPEVMLASTDAGDGAFREWQRWPSLKAVSAKNQFIMPADEIGRATPRLIGAGEALCEALHTARSKRDGN